MNKVSIKTVRRGDFVMLRNGFRGVVLDNQVNHHTRRVDVQEAPFPEIGSVYSTDISCVLRDGKWVDIEHTLAQKKARSLRSAAALACDPTSETYWSM